jgi:hypothetical protein
VNETEQRISVVQSKMETFVKACGGSVPLHAFRMYVETQERSDGVISRAFNAPGSPVCAGRTADGTPLVSLAAPTAAPTPQARP